MKQFLHDLFNDNNTINEKAVIGFAAFIMMCLLSLSNIILGAFGKDLMIPEFIFNSFLWLTLGCFGIASVDKWINKSNK